MRDQLHRLLALQSTPVESVHLNGVSIPMHDFQRDANLFLLQQKLISQSGTDLTLGVYFEKNDSKIFIPIDFGLKRRIPDADRFEYSHFRDLSNTNGVTIITENINKVLNELDLAGISVRKQSSADGTKSFFYRLAKSFSSRWASLASYVKLTGNIVELPDLPPGAEVSVETERDGQLVMYSKAYFFSTKSIFETSTPAQRWLPSGWYMFGLHEGNRTRFMDAAPFEVPVLTRIKLELP
jgi:hypothetical protein